MSKSVLPCSIPNDIQWRILYFLIKTPLPMRRRCLAITKSNNVCRKTKRYPTLNIYCCHHQLQIANAIHSPYFAHSLIVHFNNLKRFIPKKYKSKIKTKKFITDYY